VRRAQAQAGELGSSLDVTAAAEGHVIEVQPGPATTRATPKPPGASAQTRPPATLGQPVLIALDDPDMAGRLAEAIRSDGLQWVLASGLDEMAGAARRARPSLILVGRHFAGRDGLEVCREVRGDGASRADVPVVMISGADDAADRAAGADAGVTDWLIAPFSPLYARTRVRAWVLRQTCRWHAAPIPPDEPERLRALRRLRILDTAPEERFDRLTRLARHVFDVPIALVSLVDEHRQWFKSRQGIDGQETPRELSFCAHAILGDAPFVVADALLDDRFADNPAVTEQPAVRFYAGCPLHTPDGRRIGTLCIADRRPRRLDPDEIRALEDLAGLAERELGA